MADLINEFLIAKARAGTRERYLIQLRSSMSIFAAGRGHRPPDSITAAEIEAWLASHKWQPRTRLGYLIDVRNLFSFACRREYLTRNPALGVDRPRIDPAPPGIHTPEQVAAMMRTAQRQDLDIMRWLAVQYFGGLRSAEASALTDQAFLDGFLVVAADQSKTRRPTSSIPA